MQTSNYWHGAKVCVTGGAGFLGRHVCREIVKRGCRDLHVPRSADFDLTTESGVARMYDQHRFDVVVHLAAVVGGIGANMKRPGKFFRDNLLMGVHLMHAALEHDVSKFVQVGTTCAYPKHTPVPFVEEDIWDGYPEETNAPYGIAKKALLVMAQAYREEYGLRVIYLLPSNLYGPHDNFDLETSHVIPAIIRKCVEARRSGADHVDLWGTGSVSREFLYVEDAAEAIVMAAQDYDDPDPVNVGSGREIKIKDLAAMIARETRFEGDFVWNVDMPNGQPRRCLDVTRALARLHWQASTSLEVGVARTVAWYEEASRQHENGT